MNNMHVTEPIVTRAPDPDWSGWENWLRSHLDIEREVMIEACGEALGLVSHELRDRISALELKLAELTGAIDILRGTPPPPERDTRALGELLSTEHRKFGDLLERRTRGFELKLAELTGAVDILRGALIRSRNSWHTMPSAPPKLSIIPSRSMSRWPRSHFSQPDQSGSGARVTMGSVTCMLFIATGDLTAQPVRRLLRLRVKS